MPAFRFLVLGVCVLLFWSGVTFAAKTSTIYATSFDSPPFEPLPGFWAGVDGWTSTDPDNGSAAVVQAGGAVYLGAVPPAGSLAAAGRSFGEWNLQPARNPIVRVESRLAIVDSTNGRHDAFLIAVYNRASRFVGALMFDNRTNDLFWDDGRFLFPLGRTFTNNYLLGSALIMDFSTNRVIIEGLDDDGRWFPLASNLRLHGGSDALDFGSVDYQWLLTTAGSPGDNYLLLDSMQVTTTTTPSLLIERGRVQRITRSRVVLRGLQPLRESVEIEWRQKGRKKWTRLVRRADRWRLPLQGFAVGRTTVEFRLLNAVRRVIDTKRVVVVRR